MDTQWKNTHEFNEIRNTVRSQIQRFGANVLNYENNIFNQVTSKDEYVQKMQHAYSQLNNQQQQQQQQQQPPQQQRIPQQQAPIYQNQQQGNMLNQQIQQPQPNQQVMQGGNIQMIQQTQPAQNKAPMNQPQIIQKPQQAMHMAPQSSMNMPAQQSIPPQAQTINMQLLNRSAQIRPQPPQQQPAPQQPRTQLQANVQQPIQQNPFQQSMNAQYIPPNQQQQQNTMQPGVVPPQSMNTIQPAQPMQVDEEAYTKKIRDLKAYLPFLQNLVRNSQHDKNSKLSRLISIISETTKVGFDVLEKCEEAIRRIVQQQQQQMPPQINQQPQQVAYTQAAPEAPQNAIVRTLPPQQLPQVSQMVTNSQQQNIQIIPQQQVPQVKLNQLLKTQLLQQQQQQQQQEQQQQLQQIRQQQQLQLQQQQQTVPQAGGVLNQMIHQQPPIPAQKIAPPTTPEPPQQRAPLSIFEQLSNSIKLCNTSNSIHKSNVRYILDSIEKTLDGPPIKVAKLDLAKSTQKKAIKNPLMNKKQRVSATPLTTAKTPIPAPDSQLDTQLPKQQLKDSVPHILLYELSSLSTLKYKIHLKAKSFSLNLPVNSFEHIFDKDQPIDNHSESKKYSSDYISLICKINNLKMPLVPPIRIYVPYDYPNANAFVECVQLDELDDDMLPEYNTLSILRKINKLFQKNYSSLGDRHSVTQLLDAWYSSVENL